jgi:NADH dehydrogenase (ubiquinone) 1 alpha subcomplex subunit 6
VIVNVKMASTGKSVQKVVRQVKPLLSLDNAEARLRVRSLYKAWWRYIPTMVDRYELPMNIEGCRKQLRKKFEVNAHIKDIRIIDMLVVKGQHDLQEVVEYWAQPCHVMSKHFSEAIVEKPKDFMSKFLSGQD